MNNPNQTKPVHEETTYKMLVESEEKEREVLEAFVYFLLVLATITTIWQFGRQPVTVAEMGAQHAEKIAAYL